MIFPPKTLHLRYVPYKWISAAFGGRATDYTITEEHGILLTLPSGSSIQVDKGFFIENLCLALDIEVTRPIVAQKNQTQFGEEDCRHSEKSSVTRIGIEQVNRRIKEARFFKGPLPLSQSNMISSMFIIVAMFANFKPPLAGQD